MPSMLRGAGMPAASRIVGPMSMTCVNWVRRPPLSAMPRGQLTTIGLRVPPRWEATCLPHWKGVLPAHGPGGGVVRRHDLRPPRLQAAVLLDQRQLLLAAQHDPVLHRQLVERPREAAFHA